MKYEDLIKKLENKETISSDDVTGCQVFMLLHDHVLKNVDMSGNIYELNFLPIDEIPCDYIKMTEEEYGTYYSIRGVMEFIITRASNDKPVFMCLNNEYFELKVEVLETRE